MAIDKVTEYFKSFGMDNKILQWRIDGGCINDWLANIIYENTSLYFRIPVRKAK